MSANYDEERQPTEEIPQPNTENDEAGSDNSPVNPHGVRADHHEPDEMEDESADGVVELLFDLEFLVQCVTEGDFDHLLAHREPDLADVDIDDSDAHQRQTDCQGELRQLVDEIIVDVRRAREPLAEVSTGNCLRYQRDGETDAEQPQTENRKSDCVLIQALDEFHFVVDVGADCNESIDSEHKECQRQTDIDNTDAERLKGADNIGEEPAVVHDGNKSEQLVDENVEKEYTGKIQAQSKERSTAEIPSFRDDYDEEDVDE